MEDAKRKAETTLNLKSSPPGFARASLLMAAVSDLTGSVDYRASGRSTIAPTLVMRRRPVACREAVLLRRGSFTG